MFERWETISNHKEIFEKLFIKGSIFGMFSSMGPEAIFFYPFPSDLDHEKIQIEEAYFSSKFSERDYMQVAVKSISLLMSDYNFENTKSPFGKESHIFGVLPYPDISMIGFTLFGYFKPNWKDEWVPISFSILVDDNHRNFIYNSMIRLKKLMISMKNKLISVLKENEISSQSEAVSEWPNLFPEFMKFYQTIEHMQSHPISPITSNRRIRMLFTGLENTGKSSFLLILKRKFSSLPSLLPTTEAIKNKLDFLGTTIVKWDIPGNPKLRAKVIEHSQTYLYDTDLIYFFVDIQNPRINESKTYLKKIIGIITEYEHEIPFIFVLTKNDEDIQETSKIKKMNALIEVEFEKILGSYPHKFFKTSIFSIYSILNAFSYGVRLLSPNREIIEHLLFEFMARLDLISGLLLNESGIVLASAEILPEDHTTTLKPSQIFEIAAPQFAIIAKQFDSQTQQPMEIIKYELSATDRIFLKKFQVNDFLLFALFYAKTKDTKLIVNRINENFPDFLERIEHLLHVYIQ